MREKTIIILSSLAIVLTCIIKIFFITQLPIGFDQAGISYIADKIAHGQSLYIDYFDHKPPFMHYLLATIYRFVAPTNTSINAIAFVFDLALLASIFLASKRFIGTSYALLAAAIYSIFNLSLSLNTEIVMTIFGIWAVYFYVLWNQNNKNSYLFICGILLAFSLWFKQSAIIFFIALAAHVIYCSYKGEFSPKKAINNLVILTLGILVVSLPLLLYFLYTVGAYFLYVLILFNLQFSTHSSRILQVGKALMILFSSLGFLLAIIMPSAKYIKDSHYKRLATVLAFVTVLSLIFILAQKEVFYQHFFQIIPFACILAAISVKVARNDSLAFVISILLIGMVAFSLVSLDAQVREVRSGSLTDIQTVVDYLDSHVSKNASVFSDNPVYTLLGKYDINESLIGVAPSFASVLDYSFICHKDYLVLTHRQNFLGDKEKECIKKNYVLEKRFDNIGESFVEVWRKS